ncbi:hypothetical protein BJX63DRAFT_431863 [Aspergillus granulosus]|uniref:Squalene cyclase C-terminal domain-containing protein n=1 Tax=Aspergillus granulosus TaxID=176169 RepID=A0ABR4HDG2_9EURO
MGLLSVARVGVDNRAVNRGVKFLVRTQDDILTEGTGNAEAAVWTEKEFTSTGFPNHFYISYTLYRVYFPTTALGRFVKLAEDENKKQRRDSKIEVWDEGDPVDSADRQRKLGS